MGNYEDIHEQQKTYHYEVGCTDAQPRNWDAEKNGPWKPRWDTIPDFRACSLSYPEPSVSNVHQVLEG